MLLLYMIAHSSNNVKTLRFLPLQTKNYKDGEQRCYTKMTEWNSVKQFPVLVAIYLYTIKHVICTITLKFAMKNIP